MTIFMLFCHSLPTGYMGPSFSKTSLNFNDLAEYCDIFSASAKNAEFNQYFTLITR